MATGDVVGSVGLLDHTTRLRAYVLLLQVVLYLLQARLLAKPWIPLRIPHGFLLRVEHMGVAIVTWNCGMTVFLFLLRLEQRLAPCTNCGLHVRRGSLARLRATTLSTVQHLLVHEGLEVVESRAVVQADVPRTNPQTPAF